MSKKIGKGNLPLPLKTWREITPTRKYEKDLSNNINWRRLAGRTSKIFRGGFRNGNA